MIRFDVIKPLRKLFRYERWRSSFVDLESVDIYSYISAMCVPEDTLLFCKILFPDFFLVQGAVILEKNYDAGQFALWMGHFNGDTSSVEKVINHTHLYDVFAGCTEDVDDEIFEQLAEVLVLSWRLILKEKFPEKIFSVEMSNSDQDYGPVVTFFQSGTP